MIDLAKYKREIGFAEGRVKIDYFDPVTYKIKEQIKGKNHVFKDVLFGGNTFNNVASANLFITDDSTDIDTALALQKGRITGYGIGTEGGTGVYKGSWNSMSGYRGRRTALGVTSKLVYDFLPTQALGDIKNIALTNQYPIFFSEPTPVLNFVKASGATYVNVAGSSYTIDKLVGRNHKLFQISSSGVVTITDLRGVSGGTIDISALLGGDTTNAKAIGLSPSTGKMYVYVNSPTAANRRVYEFEDDGFTTVLNTYYCSNVTTPRGVGFYVHGTKGVSTYGALEKFDFGLNIGISFIVLPSGGVEAINGAKYAGYTGNNMIVYPGNTTTSSGCFISLETQEFAGVIGKGGNFLPYCNSPFVNPCAVALAPADSTTEYIRGALAMYKVPSDAPVRPAGTGMTVTYELEVQY